MIDKALSVICGELDRFIQFRSGGEGTTAKCHLTAFTDDTGKISIPDSAMGLTLVNVEEERINKVQVPSMVRTADRSAYLNPELHLNLYILIAANYKKHDLALEALSYAISFFQSKSHFTPADTPTLPDSVEKLIVELQQITFEQLNYVWGMLGTKYLPSLMYKVRMLTIQEGLMYGEADRVEELSVGVKPI